MATVNNTLSLRDRISEAVNRASRNYNGAMDRMERKTFSLSSAITGINQGIELMGRAIEGVKTFAATADAFTLIQSQIKALTRDGEDAVKNQKDIAMAAADAGASYRDFAGFVTKVGNAAKDAFGSTDEITYFASLLTKAAAAGGYSGQSFNDAMTQLTQGLASGTLRGEELNSVLEQAPPIAALIAKSLDMPIGKLRQYASDGNLSADIVKKAMFSNADEIEKKFKAMPRTFGQAWQVASDQMNLGLQPLYDKFSAWINNGGADKISTIFMGIGKATMIVGDAIMWLVNGFDAVSGIIVGYVIPALMAIGIAILLYNIPAYLAMAAVAIGTALRTAAAWLAANWPLLILIAILALIVFGFIYFGDTAAEVCGYIGGAIGVLVAFFYNKFVMIWNFIAAFVNFFGNVFNDPIYSIKKLFVDLATSAINSLKTMANAIDKLLGTNMSGALSGIQNKMQDWLGTSEKYKDYVKAKDYMQYEDAANKGFDIGKSVGKGIADAATGLVDKAKGLMKGGGAGAGAGYTPPNVPTGTESDPVNTKIKGDVTISEEDLKYLRDVAKMEYINKFTTLRPNMQVSFGDVRETADTKAIMSAIEDMTEQALASVLTGG